MFSGTVAFHLLDAVSSGPQYERTETAGFGEKRLDKQARSGIIGLSRPKESPEMAETPPPVPQPKAAARPASGDVTEEYLCTAAPGQGAVAYDDGYDIRRHQAEVDFSQWLHQTFGGDIRLLNESRVEGEKRATIYGNVIKLSDLRARYGVSGP